MRKKTKVQRKTIRSDFWFCFPRRWRPHKMTCDCNILKNVCGFVVWEISKRDQMNQIYFEMYRNVVANTIRIILITNNVVFSLSVTLSCHKNTLSHSSSFINNICFAFRVRFKIIIIFFFLKKNANLSPGRIWIMYDVI